MDDVILAVVIGLVLTYALLALLVMKMQEVWFGNLLHYRAGVMHDLLLEATGRDATLKDKLLENPLVFALYEGDEAQKKRLRDSGPSAVPPPIFARALLAELNGASRHPAGEFATPSAFVAARGPAAGSQASRIWTVLGLLLPGNETDWAGFEAAIARWFSAIGDRADGWFRRKAGWRTLALAACVVVAMNADSVNIANALASDPALRAGVASLGARVDALLRSERDAAAGVPAAAPAAAGTAPMTQLSARMTDAMNRLSDALLRDKAVANFRTDLSAVGNECKPVFSGKDTAMGGLPKDKDMLGNASQWMHVLPLLLAHIERTQLEDSALQAQDQYKAAFRCLAPLASWVRSATMVSGELGVRASMQEASAALESVKSALLLLIHQQSASASLTRAFLADPDAVRTCAADAVRARAEFDACLQRELGAVLRLPFFHTGATTRQQFCRARAGSLQAPQRPVAQGWPCDETFEARPEIGLPPLWLEPVGALAWALVAAGLLLTTMFVSLGAPFWFDLLGKVMKLRAAGKQADADADALRGRGTLALPAAPAAGAPGGTTQAAGAAAAPFASGRNRFEDDLTPAAILRLQQRLDLAQSGRLDEPTRRAIESWCGRNGETPVRGELDAVLYQRIVGRAAPGAARAGGTTRPRAGERSEALPPLAAALGPLLAFPNRVSATETTLTPDLRALAVLFRYKEEGAAGTPAQQRRVMTLPRSNPAALDEIDEALAARILAAAQAGRPFAPELPGWMDWAIGELGQVELDGRTRGTSNPRVVEYLDTAVAGAGSDGDHSPWCGAFAAWVLTRHLATLAPADPLLAQARPVPAPLRAANWASWGTVQRPGPASARYGDIVLFQPTGKDSSGHVAFVVAASATTVWALGGNQQSGTRVVMSEFDAGQVVVVRGAA